MQPDFLKGYTVLLNAHYIPGPVAAWFLQNLGARVIKFEPPGGDLFRNVPPFFSGPKGKISAYFRALNGGFSSIAVNLKTSEGVDIFCRLLQQADVYIDGNRPGFVEKITGKTVAEINPDIISVPISAYGLDGPDCRKAGHDGNLMAEAGTLAHNGDGMRGIPSPVGIQAVDITAGLVAACTALAMLLGRKNPNSKSRAKVFDTAMLDSALLLNQIYISKFSADNREMQPGQEWLNGGRGYYATYKTSDGRAAFFAAIEPALFKNFADAINREDLIEIRDRAESEPSLLIKELEKIFATKTLQQWEEALKDCDCCFSPVHRVDEAIKDPQIVHRGLIEEVDDPDFGRMHQLGYPGLFDGQAVSPVGSAPAIGQHSRLILQELGFSKEQIDLFADSRVVRAFE